MIVGGYFTWISVYGINQTQVQRYLTVKEKSQAVKYVLVAERISVVSKYMYGHLDLFSINLSTYFHGLLTFRMFFVMSGQYG